MKTFKTSFSLSENNKNIIVTLQQLAKREYNANIHQSTLINYALYCFFHQITLDNNDIDYYKLLEVLKCENQM